MKKIYRGRRPSLAFALALVALVAALSNGAYAVATAQKNSVVSKSIKNGHVRTADLAAQGVTTTKLASSAVTSSELADSAVTSAELADGAVNSSDIKDGAVTSADIATGTILGADLSEGAVGAHSFGYIQTAVSDSVPTGDADGVNNGGQHAVVGGEAMCPSGSTVIGGGAAWVYPSSPDGDTKNVYLQASHPSGNGWYARGIVDFGAQGTIRLRTFVSCLMPDGFIPN